MKVSRVAEMQQMDRTAIAQLGIPEIVLMENAGHAVFTVLESEFGVAGRKFAIVCGTGNNGGDGLVVARKILSAGGEARIWIIGDRAKYKPAAKINFDIAENLNISIHTLESITDLNQDLNCCDIAIDGIFGTGLMREVGGIYQEVIATLNASNKPVVSLDIPSGISGDTGRVMGIAVQADVTVAFGLPKIGNLLHPGCERSGKLFTTHISFPPSLYDADELAIALNYPVAIPARDPRGHKGTFGHYLCIAGAASYYGAPYFAAMAYLKAGGGYSRLAVPRSMLPFIANKGSELVLLPQAETDRGGIALKNYLALLDMAAKMNVVAIGPGMSLEEEVQTLVRDLVREIPSPVIIDGDGLTAIAKNPVLLQQRHSDTILTPHLGEMARLTDMAIAEIEADPVTLLQRCAREWNAIVVLKGARSLIASPDGRVFINTSGNSGMATAGSGDVLTGAIAAMLGLGLAATDAARAGVFMHGLAGDLAASELGEDGLTAQNILDYLPSAMHAYRQGLTPEQQSPYRATVVV
ncbi:MAG: NAD(P)H-hydrate dehydratase [Cyanobacteria bacterium P01_D01_bin.123]